ncbi:hypothetical protein D3C75_1177030 [compost metagenome]
MDRIEGEHAVFIHIVDIQINDITRDILFTKGPGELKHFLLVHIAVSRLVIADSPFRR